MGINHHRRLVRERGRLLLVRAPEQFAAEEQALAEAKQRIHAACSNLRAGEVARTLAARDHSGDGPIRPAPQVLVDVFRGWLTTIDRLCPGSVDDIAAALVAGREVLKRAGESASLLQLTRDVATMLAEAEKAGGVPRMESCAEPVALVVTMRLARA